MTCALAPSSPSSRSPTTSPVIRGASPLQPPTKWATPGPRALPSPPPRPPPLPPPLPKVTAPMRINQTGLVPEPPPPYRPPGGTRSLTWRDTTQMTPVSDFPSCRLVFSNMSTCLCLSLLVFPLPLPFSYYCISIFATGCQAPLQPCGFVALSVTFSSLGSLVHLFLSPTA